MAKNKGKKKLKKVSVKDLKKRSKKKKRQISKLKKQRKAAIESGNTKKAKQLKKQITKKKSRKAKIRKVMKKKVEKSPSGGRQKQLKRIYNSDAFKTLSPEYQKMIRGVVDSYTPQQLAKLKLGKKKIAAIEADARQAAKKEYNRAAKPFEQDYERSLDTEIKSLQRVIKEEEELRRTQQDSFSDERITALEDMKTALAEAKDRYEIESKRKEKYIQKQMGFINERMNTAIEQADEDSVLELRSLQRNFQSNLDDTHAAMADRGIARSGIRKKEERVLGEEYEDNRTTAELVRDRRIAEAERLAREQDAELDLSRDQLADMLYEYGVDQREAVRSAEMILGSGETQAAIQGGGFGINGQNPMDYMYGNLEGSLNVREDDAAAASRRRIGSQAEAFERSFGSQALNENLGGVMRSTGYQPLGGIYGTDRANYERGMEELQRQRRKGRIQAEEAGRTAALEQKFMGLI